MGKLLIVIPDELEAKFRKYVNNKYKGAKMLSYEATLAIERHLE